MPFNSPTHVVAPLRAFRFVVVALLLAPTGCQSSAPADAESDPAAESEQEVVRLTPEEAAEIAGRTREEVSVQVTEGLELSLWAPEQLLADPIALAIDDQGRVYVTRTNRSGSSEFDIRGHRNWMIESITFQTVEDRRNFLRRELAPERSEENEWLADLNGDGSHDWRDLTVEREQILRLEDTTGDGLADLSRVVISDFHTEVTDVALGLLVHENDVFLGVAPDLWRLRDTNGDGRLDSKESLSHGYGVHIGFGGHGMSGVTLGPDGRIYWAIGDIGLNAVSPDGRRRAYPNQGAIMRAEPDGSGFEVFAAGLRNTHEFVFDEYGNLISVDNDGDHPGETERLVYLVDGSDSGWRINWQFGKYGDPDNNGYKVWMEEELYKPRFAGQAAYILPPIASYHTGPSGMVYNPGTALSERWQGHFFVSEFTGSAANARIHAFRLRPKGAGFELAGDTVVLTGILTTGLEFGPDGALYLADWIEGWGTKERGRIWKLDAPEGASSPQRAETQALLAGTFERRTEADLLQLLRHPDMRVRAKAQFELARRSAAPALLTAARQREHQLARVHGLWGIGQLARRELQQAAPLTAFLQDEDAEIRAQAAKLIGDVRYAAAADALLPLLRDGSPRVRFFAAEALGRIGHGPAVQPLIEMLAANDDEDTYLRHAGSLALARIGQAEPVVALADHPSRALRIAAVVALRRMQHPGVARFLQDRDEYIVTEAARAINDDASIEAALPDLAQVLEQQRFANPALLRRAVNANLRLGTPEAARRVAAFAARARAPDTLRTEAIAALGVWPQPSILDRVDGSPRGEVTRDPAIAQAAVEPLIQPLLTRGSVALKVAMAETAGRLSLDATVPALTTLVRQDRSPEVRIAALRALQLIQPQGMEEVVRTALADRAPTVRMTALGMIPGLQLPEATTAELLASVLSRGSMQERQSALAALGTLQNPHAHQVLGGLLDQLNAGTLPAEIELDLMEAVEASNAWELSTRLSQYQEATPQGNAMAAFRTSLHGGSAARGRQVVFQNPTAQCTRCHSFGPRGTDAGPNLRRIGATLTREQLLEALVEPSARIAPGYGIVSLTLQNGQTVAGMLREETDSHLVVQTGDGETRQVATSEIAQRVNAPSAMPPMGQILSRREIRDVVEFLSTLR